MTTAAVDKPTTDKSSTTRSWNANDKEHDNAEPYKPTGKLIKDMTHAEHKAYLIAEAEKNEEANDRIYQQTVDGILSSSEVMEPTDQDNDTIREKALAATEALTAKAREAKAKFEKSGKKGVEDEPVEDRSSTGERAVALHGRPEHDKDRDNKDKDNNKENKK